MKMEIDPELARRLSVLLAQPRRDPGKAAQARAVYLDQAQELVNSSSSAVTATGKRRHIGWMHPIQQFFRFQRKEHSPMFGTILLIVSLVLGGSGAAVVAAQDSLPDQSLYPVKTWSEGVRTDLTNNIQARLELALEFTNRRAEEMQVMLLAGEVPPDAVQTRMQAEIDLAVRLATGQPNNEAVQSLEQVRQQLKVHEQAFTDLGPRVSAQAETVLDQTRAMLQDRLHLCDQGIQDPDLLREQLRDRDRLHDGTGPNAEPTSSGAGNPWTTGTPTPGSSYGPDPGDGNGGNNPWTTGTPTPDSSYGPGPGDGNGGNNPWTTGTPTPGSSYGPGPGDGAGESGGAGEPGGNENPGGNSAGGDNSQDDNGNGAGSPGGGESVGGSDQDGGSIEGGSTSGGSSDTGGSGSGSGSGTDSDGPGTGGSGGKH